MQQSLESFRFSDDFTDDAILSGKISIRQPKKGYRVAMDPIILASCVNVQENQTALDVGCGVGTISLILKSKTPSSSITSIDIDPKMCEFCRYNSQKNKLSLNVQNINLENFADYRNDHNLNSYDHVITNPPFFAKERSRISETKLVANFETMELSKWITLCLDQLKHHGIFSIIHQPSRITEILSAIANKCGSITIIPVYSSIHSEEAIRVIVQCIKGNKSCLRIMKGIVLQVYET